MRHCGRNGQIQEVSGLDVGGQGEGQMGKGENKDNCPSVNGAFQRHNDRR